MVSTVQSALGKTATHKGTTHASATWAKAKAAAAKTSSGPVRGSYPLFFTQRVLRMRRDVTLVLKDINQAQIITIATYYVGMTYPGVSGTLQQELVNAAVADIEKTGIVETNGYVAFFNRLPEATRVTMFELTYDTSLNSNSAYQAHYNDLIGITHRLANNVAYAPFKAYIIVATPEWKSMQSILAYANEGGLGSNVEFIDKTASWP